jgi:hypothetical protein
MSKENQALVQAIIRERFAAAASEGSPSSPHSSASLSRVPSSAALSSVPSSSTSLAAAVPHHAQLATELGGLGFSSAQVQQALDYAARVAHRWHATSEGLLEWLLVHVPPEQLPARWGQLGTAKLVQVAGSGVERKEHQCPLNAGYQS